MTSSVVRFPYLHGSKNWRYLITNEANALRALYFHYVNKGDVARAQVYNNLLIDLFKLDVPADRDEDNA